MGIDKMNDVEARIRFRTTPRLDHVVWPWHVVVCVLVLNTPSWKTYSECDVFAFEFFSHPLQCSLSSIYDPIGGPVRIILLDVVGYSHQAAGLCPTCPVYDSSHAICRALP